jgi:hypothetical protein
MEAVEGVTEREVKTGAVTVNAAELLIVPDWAVTAVVPWAMLVANPWPLTVVTVVADEVHWVVLVRFCVVPLL